MKIKVTEKLCSLLQDGMDVHRCAAARALGALQGPRAKEALVAALLDEDADVRVDAAAALALLQDASTAQKLMDNLIGDPDPDVKAAAISMLVAIKYRPVVPLLRALVVSRAEDQVAWDEEEFYTDGWDSWVDIQVAAIKGLAGFAEEDAVDEILAAMDDEEAQDLTEPAFEAFARMGEKGADALIALYQEGDKRLCRRIARAVGGSDNPRLDGLRADLIMDETAAIRAEALGFLEPSDILLTPMFSDADAGVRASVVRHAGAGNLSALNDLITDPDPDVRVEVFKLIAANPAAFSEKEQVKAVKKAIKGDPEAAKHAALALFALKGPKVAKGLTHVLGSEDIPQEFRIGVMETLEKAGDVAVPALLGVAGDPNRQIRLASLTALAGIAMRSPDWPNDAGLGLLSALKGELVLPPEEEAEEETIEPEPEQVAEPDQAELDEIAQEIEESLPLVAEDVAPGSTLHSIMSNLPNEPVNEPEEIILDETQQRLLARTNMRKLAKRKISWETEIAPYLDVQRFAAHLLSQVVQPEVTKALIAALELDIDEETRDAVLFSLAVHGTKTGALPAQLRESMQALLDNPNSDTRVLATRVLGLLPDEDITPLLEALLEHEDQLVRVEAVQALDHRNVAGAAVMAALNDAYVGVGIAAARALARISGDGAVDALVKFSLLDDGTYRRDIGKLLGQYAPVAGAARLLELLNDEDHKTHWLVAIDALAELFQHQAPDETRLVA